VTDDVGKYLVRPTSTIRQALQALDEAGDGILLLVDEQGKLLRTITDGDLRRLMLSCGDVTRRLSSLPEQSPIVCSQSISEHEALEIMVQNHIDHLPVVDENGIPQHVYLRRQLDRRILLSTPHLGQDEMAYVEEAFRSNWVAPVGPNIDAFEQEVAEYLGVGYTAAVSSGTAALHLALRILDVGPGDLVFCSTLTFVASASPIVYQGATPVFIDSEPESWNMSPCALERALLDARRNGRLPKAVIVVHLYGQSAHMDALISLCNRYDIPVIEDAAESLGATYKGRPSGTIGQMGVYSFNGNKIITTAGGGMLVSDRRDWIDRARHLATQAKEDAPWYLHREVGYNYRMSNILAGIGRGQLKVLSERVAARRAVFERYQEGLADVDAITWMPEPNYSHGSRWLSVFMLDPTRTTVTAGDVIDALSKEGIEARHVWRPMHMQPVFEGCTYYPHTPDWSFSDDAFALGVCLPSGSNLLPIQQERVIRVIKSLF